LITRTSLMTKSTSIPEDLQLLTASL